MTRDDLIKELRDIHDHIAWQDDKWISLGNVDKSLQALEEIIDIIKHISPRELSRCLEIAGKNKAPEGA